MNEKNLDSDIYYFLGNITSHITHALPLYEKLGGTFVVLSDLAKTEVEKYNVPVINLDNVPFQFKRFGYKIKPVSHYSDITKKHKKTVDFLNKNARVVIFYELYNFAPAIRLTKPATIFLTHGNMLKNYMAGNNRLEIIKQYDYMAALGPHMKQEFIKSGIDLKKLIDVGIARTDDVVKNQGKVVISEEMTQELGIDPSKKIVSYMPTFWGASSIYNTGLKIVKDMPEKYTLVFRPHPQTPNKIIKKYLDIIKNKSNVIYAPEGKFKHLGLVEIFDASSVIIGDVSSVMLEAILTHKPLVFAYDSENVQETVDDFKSIREVVDASLSIKSVDSDIPQIIDRSVSATVDNAAWNKVLDYNFYNVKSDCVPAIAKFISKLSKH